MKIFYKPFFLTNILWIIFILCEPPKLICQIYPDSYFRMGQEHDTIQIPFEEIELDCLCIPKNMYLIIETYDMLNTLLTQSNDPECENYPEDEIDFNKDAIIGFYVLASNYRHFPFVDITICKVVSQKKYVCLINIKENRNPLTLTAAKKVFKFFKPEKDFKIEIIDSLNRLSKTYFSCNEYYR